MCIYMSHGGAYYESSGKQESELQQSRDVIAMAHSFISPAPSAYF